MTPLVVLWQRGLHCKLPTNCFAVANKGKSIGCWHKVKFPLGRKKPKQRP